jgi:predicted amidohydrolase YtcJ
LSSANAPPGAATNRTVGAIVAAALLALTVPEITRAGAPQAAELVVTDATIYTADASHRMVQALAVGGGRILYAGSTAGAAAWIGPHTRLEHLGGRLVLPGLVDSHIHPIDIVDLDVCDLASEARSLRELSDFVRACIERYRPAPGEWLNVHEWNYTNGNQPDAANPTLRAALDRASTRVKIQLLGNDGHHGAFNSVALAAAKNAAGEPVGFSSATLAKDFAAYADWVGVDEHGEPNGAVNEDARSALNPETSVYDDLAQVLKAPARITQRLNSVGITAMLDAAAAPEGLAVYDKLLAENKLTVRANLAQYYDPEQFRRADGQVDYDAMVGKAKAVRTRYADNPLLRADTVKLFADGVLEGNPFAVPPTLPNAASLKPFLQPIFGVDRRGRATVKGYVDTASALCAGVRARRPQDVTQFMREHGFHPEQCAIYSGRLQHDRGVILEFVKRFHLAGFNLHIHAIGDTAVRTSVDALEAARAADGVTTRDGLAHVQLADSADIARIGRNHLFVAFTYAWMDVDLDYDLTVIPFIQRVQGNSYAALHVPGSYYEAHVYPVRSIQKAGGILVAGSDAPVETRDPRPFVNMARALVRRLPGQPSLNAAEEVSIRDVLDAYTINGARFLGREQDAGSLEVGKSADFIVLDQDILQLAARGQADKIAATSVLQTWFSGREVYLRPTPAAH